MIYLQVVAGLGLLLCCGDLFVRGAVGLARHLKISPLLIGLTLVGFGTSLPELVASLEAARLGSPGIAVGNVVGSNIANILLILGLAAVIAPLRVCLPSLRMNGMVMLAASILAILVFLSGHIHRTTGVIAVALLLAYVAHAYFRERRGVSDPSLIHLAEEIPNSAPRAGGLAFNVGFALLGLLGIVVGANLLVAGGIALARTFGVSEVVIGLTIVAVGTSLPELATSVIAALRKHSDVAIGNVVGSNIFNILGILGVTAMVHPIAVPQEIADFDSWIMLAATLAIMVFAVTKSQVERWEGGLLMAGYAGYIAYLVAT
jgi:cation:H+ antiporter